MADVVKLRSRLMRKPIVVAPGVYDAFTALVAEQSGFRTLYVSGAAISYTRLGRPDIGLVSMSEVVEIVGMIRDRVDADLIVDADTGYGNALNVGRTMRLFERAGANAIQLEDQDFPKRCGHLDGKVLIPAAEMAGKIKAALDARRSRETLVIIPGGIVRALGHMASEYYASLAASGTSKPFRSRMLDLTSINELIGTPEMLALGKRYESPARPSGSKKGTRR